MSRTSSPATTGPVRLGAQTRTAVRPTAAPAVTGGFMLESARDLHDLRLVAGNAECGFRGDYPLQDANVYKWLEAGCQDARRRRRGRLAKPYHAWGNRTTGGIRVWPPIS